MYFNSITALIDAYQNDAVYVYELPTGGEQWPYRLGDFRNYNTDAKSPIFSFEKIAGYMIMDSNGYTDQNGSYYTFKIMGNGDIDSSYNLTLADISYSGSDFTFANLFFGVIVTNGVTHFLKVADEPIGDDPAFVKEVTVTLKDMSEYGMAVHG